MKQFSEKVNLVDLRCNGQWVIVESGSVFFLLATFAVKISGDVYKYLGGNDLGQPLPPGPPAWGGGAAGIYKTLVNYWRGGFEGQNYICGKEWIVSNELAEMIMALSGFMNYSLTIVFF